MKPERGRAIAATRERVGWIYSELPWLDDAEAEAASRRRAELLAALEPEVEHDFAGTKPHLGELSPGCRICGAGSWGCNYINGLCSRHCFFCPQDRTLSEERDPMTAGNLLLEPDDHVRYLRELGIEGVGFSGGEPLLVLDRLVAHIEAIRRELGDSVYVWVYSNGDPATPEALRRLAGAGLDEIRFNLAARGYDHTPVRAARDHLPAVTVEIPAIPGHLERLKRLVVELDEIGVAYLNLHQLFATEHNYAALRDRGYHFLHQPSVPVLESELCALELLTFVRDRDLDLPVQYCCSAFKNRFQERGQRLQVARLAAGELDEITEAGYLRAIRVTGSPEALAAMVRALQEHGADASLWRYDVVRRELRLRGDVLSGLSIPTGAVVSLRYSKPTLDVPEHLGEGPGRRPVASSRLVHEIAGLGSTAVAYWRRLYLEAGDPREALRDYLRDYRFEGADAVDRFHAEAAEVTSAGSFEHVETGLPEIF